MVKKITNARSLKSTLLSALSTITHHNVNIGSLNCLNKQHCLDLPAYNRATIWLKCLGSLIINVRACRPIFTACLWFFRSPIQFSFSRFLIQCHFTFMLLCQIWRGVWMQIGSCLQQNCKKDHGGHRLKIIKKESWPWLYTGCQTRFGQHYM